MLTKNLGLVKSIFRQSTSPVRTDVLWYDTINNTLKAYNSNTLSWVPLQRSPLVGTLTEDMPLSSEIDTTVGLTASQAGAGYRVTIRNTRDSNLYQVESDGIHWYFIKSVRSDIITDFDGNIYTSVIIGTQEWMVENLRTTKYADGSPVPNKAYGDWAPDITGAYCNYNNDLSNKEKYGYLYNWYAVNNASGLAPTGWRIPTYSDMIALYEYIGGTTGYTIAGGVLKEVGTVYWNSPNTSAVDSYGFKMRGGGVRSSSGPYSLLKDYGYLWSSTALDSLNGRLIRFSATSAEILVTSGSKHLGSSVRCMRNI